MIRLNYDDDINCGKIKFTNADDDDDDDDTVVIQLQLQWYAWVKFLQLLPQCRKTTFLGRIRSYSFSHITNTHWHHLYPKSRHLTPKSKQPCIISYHTPSLVTSCSEIFSCDSSTCPLKIFHTGCMVPTLVLSSHVSRHCHRQVLLRHSWAIQSGAMLSPLMGREWEDVGGETKRPRDHPTHSGHKNLHSQDLSLVFPLPQGEKHIYNIYSDIFWLFDFTIVNTFIYHSSYSLTFPPCFPILSYYAASRGNCFPNHRIWFLTFWKVGGGSTFGYLGPSAGV